MNYKKYFLPILVLISIILMAWVSPKYSKGLKGGQVFNQQFVDGKVLEVVKEDLMYDPVMEGKFRGSQTLKVELLEGEKKGEVVTVYNSLNSLHNTYAKPGLKAIFTVRETPKGESVWMYNLKREWGIYLLISIFVGAVVLLGGKKGLNSLIALAFTGAVVVYVLLPLLFMGLSPVPISVGLSSIIIVVSFLLIGNFDRKTYSAILGTISGVTIAGVITYTFGYILDLTGLNLSEGEQLLYIAKDYSLKVDGLLFVSILIASLGAVMDVAMSMASCVNELYILKPDICFKELFRSAMAIGKDIVGTMINTLILAFAGGSLPLMMMIWGYGMVYKQFINIPTIAIEVVNALAGSLGIIATVPITTVVSILLIKKEREEK
nr:YibE/F family protein [uncultured Cetobacterium sp.]